MLLREWTPRPSAVARCCGCVRTTRQVDRHSSGYRSLILPPWFGTSAVCEDTLLKSSPRTARINAATRQVTHTYLPAHVQDTNRVSLPFCIAAAYRISRRCETPSNVQDKTTLVPTTCFHGPRTRSLKIPRQDSTTFAVLLRLLVRAVEIQPRPVAAPTSLCVADHHHFPKMLRRPPYR